MSNNRLSSISEHLILCGPIVRRVEPRQVAIWLALKSAATIELELWKGEILHKEASDLTDTPSIGKTEQKSTQIGKHLHLVCVNLKIDEDKALDWGERYSYNLNIREEGGSKKSLKDFDLLKKLENGNETILSYRENQLPSFVLPAKDIEHLKIIHGSCRNNNNSYEDGLSWVDELVQENLEDNENRPQQLFLSGDQIYADSVLGELLFELNEWGCTLLDEKETLPTDWKEPNTNKQRWNADLQHFPAFFRENLILSEARFTSTDTKNHLIAFGEFAAMYLSVWSDVLWTVDFEKEDGDGAVQNFEAIFDKLETLPENYGAIFRRNLTDERSKKETKIEVEEGQETITFDEIFKDEIIEKSITFLLKERKEDKENFRETILESKDSRLNVLFNKFTNEQNIINREKKIYKAFFQYFKSWIARLFSKEQKKADKGRKDNLKILHQTLPKVRRALANISTYMIFDDHEVTDDWFLNPSWRDRVFTSRLGKTIIRNGMISYALFQDWGNQPEQYNKAESGLFEIETDIDDVTNELDGQQFSDKLETALKVKNINFTDKEKVSIKKLHKEEWLLEDKAKNDQFIIRKYKKTVSGDDLVLKIFKNPKAFLLQQIPKLFTETGNALIKVEDTIDFLLGFDFQHQVQETDSGRYQLPDNRSPLIKWHYTYEGDIHKVLVIDNRTRRSYVSFAGAPGNLSFNGMEDLIPKNPEPKEDEVLFVVAPLPVFGASVLDELVGPLAFKAYDFKASLAEDEAIKTGMKGTNPDAIEAWAFDPVSQEELFKRLAPFQRIIFLSGDVHYGSSQRLHYWKKGEEKPACFVQLTASGMKNVMPDFIQYASQHFPAAQKLLRGNVRVERLGWHKKNPKPLKFEDESKVNAFLKYQLKEEPVLLPTIGWPKGTSIADNTPPDWSWRVHNIWDEREEVDRPDITNIEDIDSDLKSKTMDAFRKIASRHYVQMGKVNFTRQILFKSNIGLVTFEKSEENGLEILHNLYAVPETAKAGETQKKNLFTVHRIPLAASEEDKEPILITQK